MVVTRAKSRNKARDGVVILRGRGQDNSTEILSTKSIPPKQHVALRPDQPVLPVEKQRIGQTIYIKKHLISETNELDVPSRRKGGNHRGDLLHKPNAPITCVSYPLRLRSKRKRRCTRRPTPWSPGPLPKSKASHRLPSSTKKEVQHMFLLHIPTLPSGSDWSQVECLQYLKWEINLRFPLDGLKPSDHHRANGGPRVTEVTQIESNHQSSEQEAPLNQSIGEDLEKERFRIRNRLKHGSFQIVTNWTPIQSIESLESLGVREGTVDSSPPDEGLPLLTSGDLIRILEEEMQRSEAYAVHQATAGTGAFPDEPAPITQHSSLQSPPEQLGSDNSPHPIENPRTSMSSHSDGISAEFPQADAASDSDSVNSSNTQSPEPPPYEQTAIKFSPAGHIRLALIHDWEMLVVMEPSPFDWTYVKPRNLPFRKHSRHQNPFPPNSSSPLSDIDSSGAAARFMSLYGGDMPNNQERGFGRTIGRLFADLVSSETITASCFFRKETLPAWRASVEPVILDVCCVPAQGALDWDQMVAPILFAAQFSEDLDGRDRKASQQLASGLHSTMIVLILYYLDIRSRVGAGGSKLPSWMFVYGIIYTKSGFSIHEYYPVFRPSDTGSGGWWGAASSWAVQFEDVFDSPSPSRSQSMAALLRVCGHTQLVLKKLADWDGYERAIQSHFLNAASNRHTPCHPDIEITSSHISLPSSQVAAGPVRGVDNGPWISTCFRHLSPTETKLKRSQLRMFIHGSSWHANLPLQSPTDLDWCVLRNRCKKLRCEFCRRDHPHRESARRCVRRHLNYHPPRY